MDNRVTRQEQENAAIRSEVRSYAASLLEVAKQNAVRRQRSIGDTAEAADDSVTVGDMTHSFLALETDPEAVQEMVSIIQSVCGGDQTENETN
ncbi:hypothetical protein XU18_0686 [Perkinsela sp. CCAP 1560/4]|nr:hypothetical protein XU18_4492 [Perkinsela sp. CCAP 1560/4]KNH08916.1 hypothetical protein XU18_0686 [Perkinsela sp. CCAP 1560/4]|eukprot:KNH04282.1 hypothetical protein XU18_4492 [Perkinsela sp. CCAP 1560/4]